MKLHLPTILATIINFMIFFVILKHFLFTPVSEVINSRKEEIENNIKKAEADREQIEALKRENEEMVKKSKGECKNLVEEYKIKAEKVSEEIIKEAYEESERILERARKEIDRETEKAEGEIKKEAVELAILLSSKVLQELIDEKKHRQLIEDFIVKVGS
ncbi:F0F1 ATP synthase subunit B [Clostridium aestuarii]|uniref:ATP synthase subunit b n=1 Tax=Clostridium aestuarii TaxID=338193 RepID=A0ABT4D318_9CLOT|nr:F0F1 ATP synthase subunit B [Clostridium aestuarii]MCY6485624.1 F0F1 ATP synthase subunit B [Clostridium aestuarii]